MGRCCVFNSRCYLGIGDSLPQDSLDHQGRIDAGDVTFTNLRVTGVSTVASLFLSAGTNTNGVAYFDANGQVTSTATPSAGIQTSNFILTTNASGVPSWTDTIDGGQF